jgi:hypothetical protein
MPADEVFAKALETGTNFNQLHIVGGHDPRSSRSTTGCP